MKRCQLQTQVWLTHRSLKGYLLIESLLVVVLASILVAAALMQAQSWRWSAQAQQWSQQMALSLGSVRQRALLEQRAWRVCTSLDGQHCQQQWHGEWLAFADENDDGQHQLTESSAYITPAIPHQWRIYWSSFRQVPSVHWLATGDAADSNGSITLCPPQPQNSALRQLVISKSGRIRISQPHREGQAKLRSVRAICAW